jgi:hypothetical protein
MAKKIILIALLSTTYLLMQGSDQSLSQQFKSHVAGHELIWRGKISLCSKSDSCIYNYRFYKPAPSLDKIPAKSDTCGIHFTIITENDSLPQLNVSTNKSRLGILEYLVKWINLVLTLS